MGKSRSTLFAPFMAAWGFHALRPIPGYRYAAIEKVGPHYEVVTGTWGDTELLADSWSYHTWDEALAALHAWDGSDAPKGWFRHTPPIWRMSTPEAHAALEASRRL